MIGTGRKGVGNGGIQFPASADISSRGFRSREEIFACMQNAAYVVLASQRYEGGLPMVIMEALACGVPVILPKPGGMDKILVDGKSGLYFSPGDAQDLAARAR
ncbi:MAG: glycosyltransferase [Anaerolineales bacterium]|nr:glycosyltransferase [Anaerolineales bacterium]